MNFQIHEKWQKTTRFIGIGSRILLMKNATLFHKQIQRPNGTSPRLAHMRHVPNRSETSGSVSLIFEFGGNLFFSFCDILDVQKCHFLSHRRLAEYSELHLIYSNAKLITTLLT